jgi:hypothetical protein
MVRITRDRDLPLHYEASPLKAVVRAVGWPIASTATVFGIAGFARAESTITEALAVSLILIGGTLVVALIRCRRYEVTIGERMIELRLGPSRRILPAGCVEEATPRPATSWRRLYTPRELVLSLSVDTRPLIVPTHDPDDLRVVLVGDGDGETAPSVLGDEKSEIRNPKSEI